MIMSNIEEVILEPKLVNKIKGEFYVPAYQRGYRWEPENVTLLLDDIYENGDNNYCLQPIVVKERSDNTYELIDGQQRLTTLFLIIKYMAKVLPFIELNFSLTYETRTKSAEFLKDIKEDESNENIDFYHIYNAYKTIDEWFNEDGDDKNLKAINLYKYFGERVSVIWYEVNTAKNTLEDSIALFTRLNSGKIPLTNAELVKALFLSKDSKEITAEKQLEIATSWDTIESELHDSNFWGFITNASPHKYATKIELIFDLMSNKSDSERDNFYTFFYFIDKMKSDNKILLWQSIQDYYSLLKEWFEKRDIFHKVGYLVATGTPLQEIVKSAKDQTKTQFESSLDKRITNSLNLTSDDILDLEYSNKSDARKINKLLLLFNVESTRLLNNATTKYSFNNYKRKNWSLEHIHAQNSQGLNTVELQQEWMDLHEKSLLNIAFSPEKQEVINNLIQLMSDSYDSITSEKFDDIFIKVFDVLSEEGGREYMDTITNMALLSLENNAALNNSTFDVKRNKIIEMDKAGEYIPICTKRVFLKYYSDSTNNQLHFWGEKDRQAYKDEMFGDGGVVTKYLKPTLKAEEE